MNALVELPASDLAKTQSAPTSTGGSDSQVFFQVITAAASNPQVDIEKMERLWAMHEKLAARDAELDFNAAMVATQASMDRISTDASNAQTRSKYATYGQLDRHIRPIYTGNGFALSFDTAEGAPDGHQRFLAYVSHTGGHTRTYRADVPSDGKGAKGGDVMTKTHAFGSASAYGMRYLLKMIFNIAIGEDDDDGNGATRQRDEQPTNPNVWPEESFNKQYERWSRAVEQGLKTVSEIHSIASSKGELTADQANRIKKLSAKTPKPDKAGA